MSIETTSSIAFFVGSGGVGPFTFSFPFSSNAHVQVLKKNALGVNSLLVEGGGYTLSGAGNPSGGQVVLGIALDITESLTIRRVLPIEQTSQLPDGGPFFLSSIESAFDRTVMQIQQVDAVLQEYEDSAVSAAASAQSAALAAGYAGSAAAAAVPWIDDRAYATLALADAAAVAAGRLLVISQVWNTVPASLSASIEILPGGGLNNAGSVSINGSFRAGLHQVFFGAGSVTLAKGSVTEAYPQWFGAKGDGVTGDSAAINKALAASYPVKLPAGNYLLDSALVTRDFNVVEAVAGIGYAPSPSSAVATLTKGFNGDMFSALGKGVVVRGLYLDGKGAAYTGRGIVIDGNDFQLLENNVVLDTAGYCVEYVSRGSNSTIRGGIYTTHDVTTTAAIKFPASETNGDRIMSGVSAAGGKLFDFSGCATILVSHCSFVQSNFTSGSKKVSLVGCRVATGTPFVIEGADHTITGNMVANNIVLGTSLNNAVFAGNTIAETYGYVDNSTLKNSSVGGDMVLSFTPTFAAAGGGALGNGTLVGEYTGSPKRRRLDITFTIGSTTNLGTGSWVFGGFPLGKVGAVGTAYSSRGGNGYVMAATIGTTTALYLYAGGGLGPVQYNVPVAWAAGDVIRISVDY